MGINYTREHRLGTHRVKRKHPTLRCEVKIEPTYDELKLDIDLTNFQISMGAIAPMEIWKFDFRVIGAD